MFMVPTFRLPGKHQSESRIGCWTGLPAEIENKIMPEPNSGCWIWLGAMHDKKEGYGGSMWAGKRYRAHRLTYLLLRGPIKLTQDIDHLCRNRICVNPDHLEPCSRKTNIHRGEGIAAKNLVKTNCPQGHPYSTENTYYWNNQRFCRTCSRRYKMNYQRRKKSNAQ